MNVHGATEVLPNRFEYTGRARVPHDVQVRLAEETLIHLQQNFGREIGMDVLKLNLLPHAVQMDVPEGAGSMVIVLEGLQPCLKNLSLEKVGDFAQRGQATVIRFDLEDGPRYLAVYLSPAACPMRIVRAANGNVGLELFFVHLALPTTVYANVCLVDRYSCFRCGRMGTRMTCCGRCKQVETYTRYCSRDCQKEHWPIHKNFCGA